MDKLKITQNKMLKILQFRQKSHTNDLYKDFNVLKIKNTHKFNTCRLTHKIIHRPDNLSQARHFNKQVHDYDTRNIEGLHSRKINTSSNEH